MNVVTSVFGNATFLLGIIALIGLLIMKESFGDVLTGTIKTMLGYLIISIGCGAISPTLTPMTEMIRYAMGVEGVVPNCLPAFGVSMAQFGTETTLIFVIGFALNLLLAKFTKLKFVALTAHLQLFWAGFMAILLAAFEFSTLGIILIGGITAGLYYWLATAVSYHYVKGITTEHANFVPSVVGLVIAGEVGRVFPKDSKSTEEIEFPKSLNWLKDTIVSVSVIMLLVNVILAIIAGVGFVQEMAGATPWVVYLITVSLTFGGSIAVILYGVRTLLGALVPAFSGISEKVLPNAKLGLDYPTVYPYAGTAAMLGFLMHLLGSIVASLLMVVTGFTPLVIPGVQINFFEGAIVGVYANARGGVKNVILSSLLVGFILQFGVSLIFPYTGALIPHSVAYEAIDYNTFGLVLAKVLAILH
ncbi:MAG: PTS ascorbate transporter subunit IIC [Candidatus Pelethousia sp.]|nr:PTS ascorbate transporter subunit IIC [Candidatus Pelethousia sp.]